MVFKKHREIDLTFVEFQLGAPTCPESHWVTCALCQGESCKLRMAHLSAWSGSSPQPSVPTTKTHHWCILISSSNVCPLRCFSVIRKVVRLLWLEEPFLSSWPSMYFLPSSHCTPLSARFCEGWYYSIQKFNFFTQHSLRYSLRYFSLMY